MSFLMHLILVAPLIETEYKQNIQKVEFVRVICCLIFRLLQMKKDDYWQIYCVTTNIYDDTKSSNISVTLL